MNLWRRSKPTSAVQIPAPRTEVPMEGPTEGEVARARAEVALDEAVAKTREVAAQADQYAGVLDRLRRARERNHIREDIYRSIVGSA